MSEKKLFWSYLQNAADMNIGRYFEYDNDAYQMFQEKLSFLSKNAKVLEVGSGSGFFTNILLELFPDINLVCLEPDPYFVKELEKRFDKCIETINKTIEDFDDEQEVYDCAISHIVLHNISNPVTALKQMVKATKKGGKVVAIEPLASSRNYYPTIEIEEAFDFLWKAQIKKSMTYYDQLDDHIARDPWRYCYAKAFDVVGLVDIHNYGWTSVFTLSDTRYDFKEKQKWIDMRYKHLKSKREEVTSILLEGGEQLEEINDVYTILYDYFEKLRNASEKELLKYHEQEILHRIITIGTKQ